MEFHQTHLFIRLSNFSKLVQNVLIENTFNSLTFGKTDPKIHHQYNHSGESKNTIKPQRPANYECRSIEMNLL